MGRIVVMNHVSLDGVMQSPGRTDEDLRDGFTEGGWAIDDDLAGRVMADRMAADGGLSGWLFGRRSYEDMLGYWTQHPERSFGAALESAAKYVASSTPDAPTWPNTTVLYGDPIGPVTELKDSVDGVLAVLGSGMLVHALLRHGLVDELVLMINPLLLGRGQRLFPEDVPPTRFRCLDVVASDSGLVIATYVLVTPS